MYSKCPFPLCSLACFDHAVSHQYFTQSNIVQLDPDKHQFVNIMYDKLTINLLPPPYSTMCHNYRLDGYSCREDCITNCKVKEYLKLDGWPGDVYATKNNTQAFSKYWNNEWSVNGHMEEGINIKLLSNCSFVCGHGDDCESVQYDVRTVRVIERDEDDQSVSHSFTIGILPPKSMDIINRHVPKFEKIEFLVSYS